MPGVETFDGGFPSTDPCPYPIGSVFKAKIGRHKSDKSSHGYPESGSPIDQLLIFSNHLRLFLPGKGGRLGDIEVVSTPCGKLQVFGLRKHVSLRTPPTQTWFLFFTSGKTKLSLTRTHT